MSQIAYAALIFLFCSIPSMAQDSGIQWYKDLQQASTIARKSDKPMMIEFWADWCAPCKQLEAKTFSDPQVRQFLRDKTVAVRVNIDDHPTLAQRHNVTGIPCLVFLNGDGREVGRIVGFEPAQPFLAEAREIVK